VLLGQNIRTATERITRHRIGLLNSALMQMYIDLHAAGFKPIEIIDKAYKQYFDKGTTAQEKILLRWMLGLTQKQVQNVLRSDKENWDEYVEMLKSSLKVTVDKSENEMGPSQLSYTGEKDSLLSWEWQTILLMTIGSETMAIRGSEKSIYGKFFEKMILGSVLSVLGFELSAENTVSENVFWLTSRSEKRESDATLIHSGGVGVRFDIGFIGVGNSEITLDKTSRFAKQIEIDGIPHELRTVIIVDKVGPKSRIIEQASEIDSYVIQMSHDDWPSQMAKVFEEILPKYDSKLPKSTDKNYESAITKGVSNAPLERIFQLAVENFSDDDSQLED
jgi:hypothetical protein